MKGYSYTSTPPTGRMACTEPQCLYKGDLYLYLYLITFILNVCTNLQQSLPLLAYWMSCEVQTFYKLQIPVFWNTTLRGKCFTKRRIPIRRNGTVKTSHVPSDARSMPYACKTLRLTQKGGSSLHKCWCHKTNIVLNVYYIPKYAHNKYCKFIFQLLRHVSLSTDRLQTVYSCVS